MHVLLPINWRRVVTTALILCSASSLAHAAAYVKFDGITGESTDKDHKAWSNVQSWDWSSSVTASTQSRTRSATPEVGSFSFTKEFDGASPKLNEALLLGRVFPRVDIDVTASFTDAGRVSFLRYEFKNAIVAAYSVRGSSMNEGKPMEQIALRFEAVKVTYSELDRMGKRKGNVEFSYSVGTGSN